MVTRRREEEVEEIAACWQGRCDSKGGELQRGAVPKSSRENTNSHDETQFVLGRRQIFLQKNLEM